jgi:hypothetical protein
VVRDARLDVVHGYHFRPTVTPFGLAVPVHQDEVEEASLALVEHTVGGAVRSDRSQPRDAENGRVEFNAAVPARDRRGPTCSSSASVAVWNLPRAAPRLGQPAMRAPRPVSDHRRPPAATNLTRRSFLRRSRDVTFGPGSAARLAGHSMAEPSANEEKK